MLQLRPKRQAARSAEASGIGGAATPGAGPEERPRRPRGRNHRIARPLAIRQRRNRWGDAQKRKKSERIIIPKREVRIL